MNLTEACLRKPVFAWMLMAATIVFGLVAVSRIGISQFPDVDFPTITISASLEGAAPEIMEHDVVEPLEEAAVQVEGIRSITSTSRQGSASVTIELDLSRDVDVALQDVQTKISQAQRNLPLDLDPPVVSKSNPEDQPIMWVGLSGPFSPQLIADVARYRLKEKLQTVPGVGELTLGGYLERNVRIWIDADRLAARGLTVADVTEALRRQHIELPAGRLETEGREVNVRVMGEALDLATFRRIVLREGNPAAQPGAATAGPTGPPSSARATVYLEDVALIEDGFEDVRRLARVNGEPAQGLGIRKQRGSNAVEVAQGVRAALAEVQKTLPEGMEVGVNFDSTKFIEESVHEIELELGMAVALTALVCWMFLGSLSSTINVVLAIPMSLLGTVAAIYFLGFTLNTFTLLGLSLAVGIVVDDAIMVLENIHRHAEGGKDRVRAAREGTAEITFAALAATLAVVAIFIPIIFMEGVVGRFFLQFGVTLCIAVLLSYLEAITLAPARCAQILDVSREHRGRVGRLVDRGFEALARGYGWTLARALRFPVVVVLLGALLFAGAIVTMQRLPTEFVPSQDQGRLLVRLQTAVGSDIDETDRLFQRAEAFVGEHPAVERVFAVVGGFGGGAVNTGILFVTMKPTGERTLSQADLQGALRKELNGYPGLRAVVQDMSQSGFTAQRGFPVEFSIRGPDWGELTKHSERIRGELAQSGLVVDLDTDYQLGMPELRITPDRARAADLGVSVEAIATTLNTLVGGGRIAKYSDNGRRIDVRARLLAEQRSRPEDLARIQLRSASGALVPLTSVVSYEELPALQAITRRDRERAISIFGNVAPGHSQGEAVARVEALGRDLPAGYRLVLGGASVTFRESMGGLIFALVLGILVAYMVLASQFNSFLHPVTVLTILPLSIAGAAFALLFSGQTLNIFSMIGILLLMGIVKKNSIILVDHAIEVRREGGRTTDEEARRGGAAHEEARREGAAHEGAPGEGGRGAGEVMDARTAMLRAGPVRLRPILMTSIATLMAAVPSALALGPGAEIRAPMAAAVIGGLLVSTALSLLVVPAFYVLADDVQGRVARLRTRRAGRGAPPSAAHPATPQP
ncbi:efflux RND transporter permease subunit [Sorangium cellulosum]|uniref:Acriflavine resistance protein B n=1 Tax=Sorangium cellulosum TaxID=56 RepID=A0A150QJ89_SORCE|nr:efflux RND transporter permease subunit [Sorangium cellulosum]KYF67993.1 acriflavine resistance protein B [Sorangium cellulosum]